MARRLFGALALGCLFVSFAVPVAEGDPSRTGSMQFLLRQEGSKDGGKNCAPDCKTWISATGMIRADTAREFEAFAAKNDVRGLTIAFNSEGGSVHGAIALGRAIRKFDMTTTVGRTIDGPGGPEAAARHASLSPRADCESMCAFVLLGGIRRVVPDEARVRVHQIWLGDRRDDAAAATYSAEDLVLVQRDIGKLAQYTIEMGGSADLLELSLRIPPWEPMRVLSRDELRRMNLDNSQIALEPVAPQAATTAAPSSLSAQRVAGNSDPRAREQERGWAMAERAGAPVLTRRHPLTVEGEEIGSIELSFACGATPNDFRLLYGETRSAPGDATALKSVEVRLNGKAVALTPDAGLSASGVVTAAMLKGFAAQASRSLTVATALADSAPVTIRVGNANAFGNLPVLLRACSQPPRAEHADLKAGR